MLWEHLREEEFEDAVKRSGGVCVIPLGCIEKHGQHLPQGTD
ncbi:MAG: creatininase family protein, partial [Clostridia bacterium]|nr:creatininase family protein [Clostridia bacterium]